MKNTIQKKKNKMVSEEENKENPSLDDLYNNLKNLTNGYRDLFNTEEEFMPPPIYSKIKLFGSFREYALFFIELNSKHENFDAFVPYLAMTYVDRFASTCNIPKVDPISTSRNTHLFLTSCLTIASKMRKDDFKMARLLRTHKAEMSYTGDEAFQMECAICEGLKWKLQTITPFCFVDFFINLLHRCSDIHPVIPRHSVYQIITKSFAIVELLKYRPSCMAAAAVMIVAFRLYPDKVAQAQFMFLIDSTQLVTLVRHNWLSEDVVKHLGTIDQRLCVPDPVPPVAAPPVPPEEARLRDVVPMRWNQFGPMDFKLDWFALAWEMLEVEDGVDATRAAEYYFSLLK